MTDEGQQQPATEADANTPSEGGGVTVASPEFSVVSDAPTGAGQPTFERLYDVAVTVTAELGRITLPIGDLLELGEGSVVELNRPVSNPVDIMAQGVRLARGEVVVIDDCFAVKIKEIESPSKAG